MSNEACERIKREVIAESNRIRTNPKAYIPILEGYLKNFDGNLLTLPDKHEILETEEGPRAYKEAIEFLKNQKPINVIEYDEEASKVALEYSKFLSNSKEGQVEDENQIEQRVEKYLDYDYSISENIDFGGSTGVEVIVNLLVDDGVKNRTHRENLFSDKYEYYGVGVFEHPDYDFCTVIDYFGDILGYKDPEKNKIFQAKKAKKKPNLNKKYFPMTKKGLPNLAFKRNFNNKNQYNNNNINININKKSENENQDSSSAKTSDKKTVSEFEGIEEININNENPFYDDPDAPEGCVKRKTKYKKKKFINKTLITTIKTYILEDGSEEVVTIDEVIFD
jgi:uncharacterized protein YkwD